MDIALERVCGVKRDRVHRVLVTSVMLERRDLSADVTSWEEGLLIRSIHDST